MRFAVALAICGGYMMAAQDAQPWWVSLCVAVLLGSILLPADAERDW